MLAGLHCLATTAKRAPATRPRRGGRLGGWLALLALLALNLQGLLPYSRGMLQDPDICSSRPGASPAQGDTKALQHAGCDLCCAQAQAPFVPTAAAFAAAAFHAAGAVVVSATAHPAGSRAWSPGHPRGPPPRAWV